MNDKLKELYDALDEVIDTSCLDEWLDTPNDAFDRLKPIEVIKSGNMERIWEMVYRLRSGDAG